MMRDDLGMLVQQMIDRGILFDDAQREFERMFLTRALARTNFNVCKAARMTGLHRNTLSRKMAAYKIAWRGRARQIADSFDTEHRRNGGRGALILPARSPCPPYLRFSVLKDRRGGAKAPTWSRRQPR